MNWFHIRDVDKPESVYLSRLRIVKTRLFGIYLHVIRRPDYAACQHDHPWPFVTVILRGGYVERVGDREFTRRPGYVGYRPSDFAHTITKLPNGNAVTLVFRGRDSDHWGFRTALGWMDWRKFNNAGPANRVLWCEDPK